MVQGQTETGEKYKPSEHDGRECNSSIAFPPANKTLTLLPSFPLLWAVKEDGTPDKRVSSEHGFGGDRERASEAGKSGGSSGEKYKPTEHDGLKEDGTPDKRTSSEHGFGADRERASELGKQGGSK
ncbi:hypothetical protein QFC21_000361 [Naganishia friedmannii]|uniref:Uncharacterized protein n=1 Tax=Naganishia friedmannii TaxID=89922 RepID=A0ACC2WD29_9TREE|nr:hypothetical protein QFC21_000361 [Naganishia friedmannii]